MNPTDFDIELDELHRRSTGRLLSSETFDPEAFEALREYICRKGEELRSEYVISKQLLSCIRGASSAIRNQAAYVPAARENLLIADDFELLLDLLIASEGCGDRKPGLARII